AVAPFVLKSDREANDRTDNFHDRKGFIANDVIKELVGDVGAIAFVGEEAFESLGVFDVLAAFLPAQNVPASLVDRSRLLEHVIGQASDKPALDRLVRSEERRVGRVGESRCSTEWRRQT